MFRCSYTVFRELTILCSPTCFDVLTPSSGSLKFCVLRHVSMFLHRLQGAYNFVFSDMFRCSYTVLRELTILCSPTCFDVLTPSSGSLQFCVLRHVSAFLHHLQGAYNLFSPTCFGVLTPSSGSLQFVFSDMFRCSYTVFRELTICVLRHVSMFLHHL